jgi:hypothetical protein
VNEQIVNEHSEAATDARESAVSTVRTTSVSNPRRIRL